MPTLQRFMMFLKTQSDACFIESMIACFAAPVIDGLKCGHLLNLSRRGQNLSSAWNATKDELAARFGVEFLEVAQRSERSSLLILIYDRERLLAAIDGEETRDFLRTCGYNCDVPGDAWIDGAFRRLVERFERGVPHEVGVFLGYPLEDVRGFIENEGRNAKCAGYWKVYGDERAARRTFRAYRRSEWSGARRLLRRAGVPAV